MSPLLSSVTLALHSFVLAATSTTKKTSSSGATLLIYLAFILLIGYFLLIRPQRQRARRTQQTQQEIGVGDEVMLTSGIIGRVQGFEGDRARIEISDGIEIEVLRRAIAQRLTTADEPDEDYGPGDVGPDPGSADAGHFDHASDETYELPHETDLGDDDASDDTSSEGASPTPAGAAGGTEPVPPLPTDTGASEHDEVPRVPGGGLGSTKPDGRAGGD